VGSGFRTFTAGEVLTASNVQNYLMDQSVMVFGGSAARSSAIGTANFEEGMVSYLEDTNLVEVYNGTNWASIAPVSTSGLTLINTTSFSGVASQSLPTGTFTSTYKNYHLIFDVTNSTNSTITWRGRTAGSDNTGTGYAVFGYVAGFSSALTRLNITGGTSIALVTTTNTNVAASFDLLDPLTPTGNPILLGGYYNNAAGDNSGGTFRWTGNAAGSDSMSLIASTGTISGIIRVYGYNQ
jgi:hypothetical protein